MFDSYTIRPGDSYSRTDVDVHVHRAPTDKSVELLAEFEKNAREKVIGAFEVKFNSLHTKWWIERTCDVFEGKAQLRVLVDLNGKRHDFKLGVICIEDIRFKTPKVIVNEWKNELANQIAETLLMTAVIEDKQFQRDLDSLFKYKTLHI